MARHFCSQASVLSTTQRRALRRLRPRLSSFSSPIRRMCVMYPASSAASSPVGLSYPLSKHKCCSTSSGSGRSMTTAFMVSSSSLQSCRFAPSSTTDKGPPSASTSKLFLLPAFPRSVGLGPVFSPAKSGFVGAAVGSLPCPIKAAEFGALGGKLAPDALKNSSGGPHLKPVVDTAVVAKFAREMVPLATRAHTENYRFKNAAKINRSFASDPCRWAELGKHRFETLPQGVRNFPDRGHNLQLFWHWLPLELMSTPLRLKLTYSRD